MSTKEKVSQVAVFGKLPPKSWADYRQGCLDTFSGGHRDDGHIEAFRHGMETVFNLLETEFPPAEQCSAVPEILKVLKDVTAELDSVWCSFSARPNIYALAAHNAIRKAKGE